MRVIATERIIIIASSVVPSYVGRGDTVESM